MIATDAAGTVIGEGIAEQARYIFTRLGRVLAAMDATPSDVVKTTDYVTTTEGYSETADVRRDFFGEHRPAATGVVVSRLLHPLALIEIEAVVVVANAPREVRDRNR